MTSRISLYTVTCLFLLVLSFDTVFAGVSLEGNEICASYGFQNPALFCGMCPPQKPNCTIPEKGIKGCDCSVSPPTGSVSAKCVTSSNCKGTGSTDQEGKQQGVGDAKGMMDALKQVMDMLKQAMQKKGGGGGGDKGQQQQPPGPEQGCKQYYQVTAPSSDPCAYYVPPTSNSLLQTSGLDTLGLSGSEELLDALDEGSALNVSDELLGTSGQLPEEFVSETGTTTEDEPENTQSSSSTVGTNLSGQQVSLQSGTRGDIVITKGGATFVAQARDQGANTEVAGFYGSDTYGGQSQGIVAGMCKNRPWASSVVSFVVPPAFFDSLCAWRGYQVGAPAPPSQPVVEKKTTSPASPKDAAQKSQTPTVEPRVEIWAVPDTVPLGTRTSVFWNTSGVESCSITSPDGSFNETSLSGGAATVPLSGPTTFTISCLTPEGTPITDYVEVMLAI